MDVFLELAVILVVAKVFGYLATKIKMPGALGQLIGGTYWTVSSKCNLVFNNSNNRKDRGLWSRGTNR